MHYLKTYIDRKDAFLTDGTKLGTIVTYNDGYSFPYTHLSSSMLGYASINLFSMINRFPEFAVRVATDSVYIDVKHSESVAEFTNPDESWGSWRIKKETPRDYSKSADVAIKNIYLKNDQISELSNAPLISDPICSYKTVYLGRSGKTTRAI